MSASADWIPNYLLADVFGYRSQSYSCGSVGSERVQPGSTIPKVALS
jgi:hypothetical protein